MVKIEVFYFTLECSQNLQSASHFLSPFNKYLRSIYYAPGNVLGAGSQ